MQNQTDTSVLFRQAATSMSAGILMIIIGAPPQVPILGFLFSLFSIVVLIAAFVQVVPQWHKFPEIIKQLGDDLSVTFIIISLVAIFRNWAVIVKAVNDISNSVDPIVLKIQSISSSGILFWVLAFSIAFCLVSLVEISRTLKDKAKKLGWRQTVYRFIALCGLTAGCWGIAQYMFTIGNGTLDLILLVLSVILTTTMFLYLRWHKAKFMMTNKA